MLYCFLCPQSPGSWNCSEIKWYLNQIAVTCQLFPIKTAALVGTAGGRLWQWDSDGSSHFVTHRHKVVPCQTAAPTFPFVPPSSTCQVHLEAAKEKEIVGRGSSVVFVLHYQSQVHFNGQWSSHLCPRARSCTNYAPHFCPSFQYHAFAEGNNSPCTVAESCRPQLR